MHLVTFVCLWFFAFVCSCHRSHIIFVCSSKEYHRSLTICDIQVMIRGSNVVRKGTWRTFLSGSFALRELCTSFALNLGFFPTSYFFPLLTWDVGFRCPGQQIVNMRATNLFPPSRIRMWGLSVQIGRKWNRSISKWSVEGCLLICLFRDLLTSVCIPHANYWHWKRRSVIQLTW